MATLGQAKIKIQTDSAMRRCMALASSVASYEGVEPQTAYDIINRAKFFLEWLEEDDEPKTLGQTDDVAAPES